MLTVLHTKTCALIYLSEHAVHVFVVPAAFDTMATAAPGDGIHLTWQYCLNTKPSHEELCVPFSALIELLAPVEGMHVLQYPPSLCGNCKSALNCYSEVDYERSMWRCPVWYVYKSVSRVKRVLPQSTQVGLKT
jgi:hypothetical protein